MTPAPRDEIAEAMRLCLKTVDECYVETGHVRVGKASRERLAIERGIEAVTALLSEADAARAKALEEAAKVCDAAGATWGEMYERIDKHTHPENKANAHGHRNQARALATEIRALAAQDRAKETG